MSRRLVSITLDNIDDLPWPCRECVFWETGHRSTPGTHKDDWLSAVLLEWGSCGRILSVDGQTAGYALYAPPEYVGGLRGYATSEVSADAILLMTARILPAYSASGLGRVLIQSVVKDALSRRGVRALEAFGDVLGEEMSCVIPSEFLTAVGFKTVHLHPRYPRLRLDLRTVLTWRGDVEVALERWLGAIRPDASPVGVRPRTESSVD
ncbi:MAG: GNAT family N-acetyltransferase [Propionibacteriales bacterium]|nr:GNAT family N-acetyltransferase [Propionibacteriales bacterium]